MTLNDENFVRELIKEIKDLEGFDLEQLKIMLNIKPTNINKFWFKISKNFYIIANHNINKRDKRAALLGIYANIFVFIVEFYKFVNYLPIHYYSQYYEEAFYLYYSKEALEFEKIFKLLIKELNSIVTIFVYFNEDIQLNEKQEKQKKKGLSFRNLISSIENLPMEKDWEILLEYEIDYKAKIYPDYIKINQELCFFSHSCDEGIYLAKTLVQLVEINKILAGIKTKKTNLYNYLFWLPEKNIKKIRYLSLEIIKNLTLTLKYEQFLIFKLPTTK